MELETFVVQFCIAPLIRDIKDLTGLPDAETPAYGKKLLAAVNVRFEVIHERENLARMPSSGRWSAPAKASWRRR